MSVAIAIASDHAGLSLKKQIVSFLESMGHSVEDLGTHDSESVDYPDYANALCAWVMEDALMEMPEHRRGILICGSGIGMSMAANRHAGIRAALCHNGLAANFSRRHNDANVLCLGERFIGSEVAFDCVRQFLETEFEGGRHERRIEKMSGTLLPPE